MMKLMDELIANYREQINQKDEEIEALRAENARLREALEPFACKFDEEGWQAIQTAKDSDWFRWVCTAGEIRAARAAMGESDE